MRSFTSLCWSLLFLESLVSVCDTECTVNNSKGEKTTTHVSSPLINKLLPVFVRGNVWWLKWEKSAAVKYHVTFVSVNTVNNMVINGIDKVPHYTQTWIIIFKPGLAFIVFRTECFYMHSLETVARNRSKRVNLCFDCCCKTRQLCINMGLRCWRLHQNKHTDDS